MNLDILVPQNLCANDGILDEVLRHAAADHEQTCSPGLDLDLGQFAKIRNRIDHHVGLSCLCAIDLVLDEPEAGR